MNTTIPSGLVSTSLSRAPGPKDSFVRGKSGHVPFWPGGLEEIAISSENKSILSEQRKGLRTIPPGFCRGLRLSGEADLDDPFSELESKKLESIIQSLPPTPPRHC